MPTTRRWGPRAAMVSFSISGALAATAALAQVAPPGVASLAWPLVLRGRLESDRAHGCSRSHESVSAEAGLELQVDAGGRASLRLEGETIRVSGPSYGAYVAGDHDFSTLTELHETRWTGTARPGASASELLLDFVEREGAELRISGYGRLPLPPPVSSHVVVSAVCRKEDRSVLPPSPTDGERATPTSLLVCTFGAGAPDPLDRHLGESAELAFGAGPGVRTLTRAPEWGLPTRELRRVE